MTELLLHIGGEKTGTTSLQAFLTRNAGLLLQNHDILYPTSGPLFIDCGHFPVPAAFLAPEACDFLPAARRVTPATVRAELLRLREAHRPRLIVLSGEHFSSRLDARAIAALAATLAGFAVRILLYVRRQDDLAVSAFSSAVRAGARRWLDIDAVAPETRFFNYLTIADEWAAAFGRDSVRLRSFDAARDGIERDFLSALGIDDAGGFAFVKARNRKISIEDAVVIQLLNTHLPSWKEAVQAKQENGFFESQYLRERIRQLAAAGLSEATSLAAALSPEARAAIMAKFSAANARLADRYGVRIPADIHRRNAPPLPEGGMALEEKVGLLARTLVDAGREIIELERQVATLQARTMRGRARMAKASLKRYLRTA